MKEVEKFDPDEMLQVMNTYRWMLPAHTILAQNRRGLFHIIIPGEHRNQRVTFTNYGSLVRFLDNRV